MGDAAIDLGAAALSLVEALPETPGGDPTLRDAISLREATKARGIVGLADVGSAEDVVVQRIEALTRTLSDIAGELVDQRDSARLRQWLLDIVKDAGSSQSGPPRRSACHRWPAGGILPTESNGHNCGYVSDP